VSVALEASHGSSYLKPTLFLLAHPPVIDTVLVCLRIRTGLLSNRDMTNYWESSIFNIQNSLLDIVTVMNACGGMAYWDCWYQGFDGVSNQLQIMISILKYSESIGTRLAGGARKRWTLEL